MVWTYILLLDIRLSVAILCDRMSMGSLRPPVEHGNIVILRRVEGWGRAGI